MIYLTLDIQKSHPKITSKNNINDNNNTLNNNTLNINNNELNNNNDTFK